MPVFLQTYSDIGYILTIRTEGSSNSLNQENQLTLGVDVSHDGEFATVVKAESRNISASEDSFNVLNKFGQILNVSEFPRWRITRWS